MTPGRTSHPEEGIRDFCEVIQEDGGGRTPHFQTAAFTAFSDRRAHGFGKTTDWCCCGPAGQQAFCLPRRSFLLRDATRLKRVHRGASASRTTELFELHLQLWKPAAEQSNWTNELTRYCWA